MSDFMVEDLYLSKDVANVFNVYGGVEKSVNRILDEASTGAFDIMDKPAIAHKSSCRRYRITIHNKDYIDLRKMYPINSSKVSLRRLCEWYVDNELYTEWEPTGEFDDGSTKYKEKILDVMLAICDLQVHAGTKNKEQLSELLKNISIIYEENFNG